MMRLKSIIILWLFLLISPSLWAQLTIGGTVTDAQTGETLAGVNVYLANTTLGASTNGEGIYKITNIPYGIYVLVFSFVGFKTKTFQLEVKNASATQNINVSIQPHPFELEEAKVTGSNKEWKRNFERFRKVFIGQSKFAEQTSIENPWVINFTDEKETNSLVASARRPLTIINNALGYRLNAELVEFKWSHRHHTGIYKIYSRYEPLKAETKKQARRWRKNRNAAYLGSFQHFLRSLYRNKLKQHYFSVDQPRNIVRMSSGETKYELLQRGFIQTNVTGYILDRPVRVRHRKSRKVASIESNTESNTFLVHKTGKLLDPASLILFGDWGRARVADSLPDNYTVAK